MGWWAGVCRFPYKPNPLGRCAIGWAVLDGNDPTQIIARSEDALLVASEPWEVSDRPNFSPSFGSIPSHWTTVHLCVTMIAHALSLDNGFTCMPPPMSTRYSRFI